MCKLFLTCGINEDPANQKKALRLLGGAKAVMSATDKDGYGYAGLRLGADRWAVVGEKWVNPARAFRDPVVTNDRLKRYSDDLGEAVIVPDATEDYARFDWGSPEAGGDPMRVLLGHARLATCGVNIENTHPFFDAKKRTVLIHNGVISNHITFDKTLSTCDSEAILKAYVEEDVAVEPSNLQAMADRLEGSYAAIILAHDGDKWIVDVIKDDRMNLYACYLKDLDCYCFATTPDIIKAGCKAAGIKRLDIVPFRNDTHLRLDAGTGKKIMSQKFDSSDYTYHYSPGYRGHLPGLGAVDQPRRLVNGVWLTDKEAQDFKDQGEDIL